MLRTFILSSKRIFDSILSAVLICSLPDTLGLHYISGNGADSRIMVSVGRGYTEPGSIAQDLVMTLGLASRPATF